jgi:hypothetical protein
MGHHNWETAMSKKTGDAPLSPPTLTKSEAVRRVLAETPDITPSQGALVVKARYGIDVSTNTFSSFKSTFLKPKAVPTPAPSAPVPATAPTTLLPEGAKPLDPVQLLRDVRGLVEKYGAKTVADVAAVLGES